MTYDRDPFDRVDLDYDPEACICPTGDRTGSYLCPMHSRSARPDYGAGVYADMRDEWTTETRTAHYYQLYGRPMIGYGPSMDPHRCGHPDEPCWKVTETRKVTKWTQEATTD